MTIFGFHASHEQFPPEELLECVVAAERAGFQAAMCSDHFHPWAEAQGHSGFAWSWLGAALQATTLPIGVVTVPGGWRYHPTVLAQAAATLARMYPRRFWVAPGSGEALNERVVGRGWPGKAERNARLREGVDIMRRLWNGEAVDHHGLLEVQDAKLYTRPDPPPPVLGAALTPETAAWLAAWTDGLLTVDLPDPVLREVIDAFRTAGGEGKPVYLQVHVSWADTDDRARSNAHEQWRFTAFESLVLADLHSPAHFEAAARWVRPADLDAHVRISADPARHVAWLQEDRELGVDAVFLHNVGRNQRAFIETFGRAVLPALIRA